MLGAYSTNVPRRTASSKKDAKRKCERVKRSPIKHERDAMGGYVIPKGGKPLTCLDALYPGPSDYTPKWEVPKYTFPLVTIKGRVKPVRGMKYKANPASVNIAPGLTWARKDFTFGQKWNKKNEAKTPGKGPAHYHVGHNKEVGMDEFAHWSIAGKAKGNCRAGPPDPLLQPVDVVGLVSGELDYLPESERGPESTMGYPHRPDPANIVPGPGRYKIKPKFPEGASARFAGRVPEIDSRIPYPGPGTYEIGTTVGKGLAKSLAGWHDIPCNEERPAPSEYDPRINFSGKHFTCPKKSMAFRPLSPLNVAPVPGPGHYNIADKPHKSCETRPRCTFGSKTKPTFTDMHSKNSGDGHVGPGPATYVYDQKPLGLKFTLKKAINVDKSERKPGPHEYSVNLPKNSPKFSMGAAIPVVYNSASSPGPAAYYPNRFQKHVAKRKGKPVITGRPTALAKDVDSPGPQGYDQPVGASRFGVACRGQTFTLKGRASPFMYLGLPKNM